MWFSIIPHNLHAPYPTQHTLPTKTWHNFGLRLKVEVLMRRLTFWTDKQPSMENLK